MHFYLDMSLKASMYDTLERIFGFIFDIKYLFSFYHDKQHYPDNIIGTCDL